MVWTWLVPAVVVTVAAVWAGVHDARTFRIPNRLTVPLFLSGLVYHAAVGGWVGLQSSVEGAVVGFGIMLLMYVIGGMGAGDVKLLTALGAWLGMETTLYVFVVAALMMGLYSMVMLVRQGRLRDGITTIQVALLQLSNLGKHLGRDDAADSTLNLKQGDRRGRLIPFGTVIMVAVIAVLVWNYFAQ